MATRILWITDEVPDAGRGGGSIRQYHMLRRVAEKVEVDLLLAGELTDADLRDRLRKVVAFPRPASHLTKWGTGRLGTARRRVDNLTAVLPGRPPSEVVLNRKVASALRRRVGGTSGYELVQVEHEHLGGLVRGRAGGETRWAITLHNLLSVRLSQRAKVSIKPRVRRLWEADAQRALTWEKKIARDFDLTVVVSDEDARTLPDGAVVVPNGVDLTRFAATPLPPEHRMVFSGSFNYEPNIDAATWLCEDILPIVRTSVSDATLVLVGREPNERVRRLGGLPGVETHFDVTDVRPLLGSARVAVVALRQGSGTRLKALEAMSAGRPVAGTSIGLEGLRLEHGVSALVADTADGLARAVVDLFEDDDMATRLAGAARAIAETRFGWDAVAESYLDQVLGSARRHVAAGTTPAE